MGGKLGPILLATVLSVPGLAGAQQSTDLGKYEYWSKCATCHGISGKGDGPMGKFLTKSPSDLTTLAKRNGGAFPTQLVWQSIDGRPVEIGPHGTRDMPIWGQDYRREILQRAGPASPSAEWYVTGKIIALLDFLATIQVK